jgi:hypothetical protein
MSLASCLDPVVDLFDRLGNRTQALVGQDQDGALGHSGRSFNAVNG